MYFKPICAQYKMINSFHWWVKPVSFQCFYRTFHCIWGGEKYPQQRLFDITFERVEQSTRFLKRLIQKCISHIGSYCLECETVYREQMAASKPEVLIILVLYARNKSRYTWNINGNTHIFGIRQSNETIENAMRLNRKCEIQDGSHKTGSNYISARGQVSYEIPTAISK